MNNVSVKDIDVNKLPSLGIYELRNLARMLGLSRPTTLKREELIEQLRNQIICGGTTKKRSTRGRPPRDFAFDVSKIIDEDDGFYSNIFESEISTAVHSPIQGESRYISGFIHLIPNKGHGVLIGKDINAYYVSAKIISSYSLAMGDCVDGKAVFNVVRQNFTIETITSINGIPAETYNANAAVVHFDALEGVRPNKETQIANYNFKIGSRVLIVSPKTSDRVDDLATLTHKDLYTIALLPEETDDAGNYLIECGIQEVYIAKVNYNAKKQTLLALTALFKAKQLAEMGKDVLVVTNLSALFKVYNNSAWTDGRLVLSQVNLAPMSDLKNFFMSARALKGKGSLTIIGYINKPTGEMETYLYNEFTDLANTIIAK